jgi:hypothetical protein
MVPTQPQPKKSLFERIVLWAGGILTILTLVFVVIPNLQPKPRPDLNVEITAIEIERDVTYETYLLRNQLSIPPNFTCRELKSNGILIKPAFKLIGLQGETLQVKWSMFGAQSKRLVPSNVYLSQLLSPIAEYTPKEQTDIRIFEYWLPYPQLEGELYVRLELLVKEKDGFRAVAYKDTEPFPVTMLPECTGPVLVLPAPPTISSSSFPESTTTAFILPTSTFAPIPRSTSTPIPASKILFEESFLNNSNGWHINTFEIFGANVEEKILGSKYLHIIECPLSYAMDYCSYYFYLPGFVDDNFGLTFDVTIEQITDSPTTDVIIGIQFRKSGTQGGSRYYAAYFRSSGVYVLGMVRGGSVEPIKEDQMGSFYNSQVGFTNKFGIEADDALFSLYVNDVKLTTVEDGNITGSGRVDFAVSVPKGGKARISFDNVVLRKVP